MKKHKPIKQLNEKGQLIYIKYPNGFESWQDFDDNGNVKYRKIKKSNKDNCVEEWFDDKYRTVRLKENNGIEYRYTYTDLLDKGFYKHIKIIDNENIYYRFEYYNSYRQLMHSVSETGYKKWYDYYDNGGPLKHTKDSCSFETWYEYKGRIVFYSDSKGEKRTFITGKELLQENNI